MTWAAVVRGAGLGPTIEDIVVGELRQDEVRITVAATGVCHTDVAWAAGDYGVEDGHFPAVLGHETAGMVAAVGSEDSAFAVGDRVVVALTNHCGACRDCETGSPILCGQREALPHRLSTSGGATLAQAFGVGGFAETAVVRAASLVRLPDDISLTSAAVVGCALACGAGAALNVAGVRPGSTVVVFGAGAVGLSVVIASQLAGAEQVLVVEPNEGRRRAALALGATDVVADDASVGALVPREGFDFAFESAGRPVAMESAVGWTRRGGTVTLMGAPAADETFTLNALEFVSSQRRLLGCLGGNVRPHDDFERYFRLHRRGRIDIGALVTRTRPFSDIAAAFEDCRTGDGLRTVLVAE